MNGEAHLAVDLGAESGRIVVGVFHGGTGSERLSLHELHRFPHRPISLPSGLHWDIGALNQEIVTGMRRAASWSESAGVQIRSAGVDTWGVDYALIGASGEILGLPRAYRDARHSIGASLLEQRMSFDRIYRISGIQRMAINTLPQLVAHQAAEPRLLAAANRILMMPDLFHYLLSGEQRCERTIASTSQLLGAESGTWDDELIDATGAPSRLFGGLIDPGTHIGTLRPELAAECGLPPSLEIVTPASHDTACAVAALPASSNESWCYLSSGTWSLLGAELSDPCLTDAARDAGFTNERGALGTIRFHKNITGLWMVQECRRQFQAAGLPHDYDTLTELAAAERPFQTRLDAAQAEFLSPGRMIEKIKAHAAAHGDPLPESPGQIVRCCLEGLAMAYRRTLLSLEKVLGRRFRTLHLVGGGAHNELLNQMTADATDRRVVAGPFEATATGNILTQAIGTGRIRTLQDLRRIARASATPVEYAPRHAAAWDSAYDTYAEILG